MKRIALLVFEDSVLVALSGVLDLLNGTNHYLQQNGQPPAFDVTLAGMEQSAVQLQQPARFLCDVSYRDLDKVDLIIIPSFMGEPDEVLEKYTDLVRWLDTMYKHGVEVASLCRGSLFSCRSGIA
jgi:transcriptional regulator GlxA family with amidase domain